MGITHVCVTDDTLLPGISQLTGPTPLIFVSRGQTRFIQGLSLKPVVLFPLAELLRRRRETLAPCQLNGPVAALNTHQLKAGRVGSASRSLAAYTMQPTDTQEPPRVCVRAPGDVPLCTRSHSWDREVSICEWKGAWN